MLQNIFPTDHHCKTQSGFSELLEKLLIAKTFFQFSKFPKEKI